jgi:glutaredoxin 3
MEIKVYSTPTCPYCKMVKDFLAEKGLSFKEVDVSSDQAAVEEMVKQTGQMGVPVVVIDGESIVGFDKEKIENLLGKKS